MRQIWEIKFKNGGSASLGLQSNGFGGFSGYGEYVPTQLAKIQPPGAGIAMMKYEKIEPENAASLDALQTKLRELLIAKYGEIAGENLR